MSNGERQISHGIDYMWNLKILCKWTYLQDRSRGTDVENKLMVTRRQGINGRLGLTYARCYVHSFSAASDSLWPHGLQPARLLHLGFSPGKHAGVGCHSLLQGIFPTQGLNPHHLHGQADSLPLSHLGSPVHTTLYKTDNQKENPTQHAVMTFIGKES